MESKREQLLMAIDTALIKYVSALIPDDEGITKGNTPFIASMIDTLGRLREIVQRNTPAGSVQLILDGEPIKDCVVK